MLDAIKATSGPAAAREMERFIRAQHDHDERYHARFTPESDLGVSLDVVLAERDARFATGTGGGHRRHKRAQRP